MTDKEILNKLEKKFGDDLAYYDKTILEGHSPILLARRNYAKESLDFIKELRSNL